MSRYFLIFLSLISFSLLSQEDSVKLRKIYDYHLTSSKSYENLRFLCKKIGNRISGSVQAAEAVNWTVKAMKDAGADSVYLIPCKVPKWVRGKKEKCAFDSKKLKVNQSLSICALGGSVATPKGGLKAKVLEISSFEQLEKLDEKQVQGKIIFFNVKFDSRPISTGQSYGSAVKYRYAGASKAASKGAVASITRSMTHAINDSPHTGAMGYDSTVKFKIPACAISTASAEKLSEMLKKDSETMVSLELNCETFPDVESYSVVGEIKGAVYPDEVITVGGHLDSWDLGEGAHDDGAGVVQSLEQLAFFSKMENRPKRTIRAIAFMNEENGTRGGRAYAEFCKKSSQKQIAALESDAGGFTPRGIGIDGNADTLRYFKKWQDLLSPFDLTIRNGGGGADIGFLEPQGVLMCSFIPDSQRYFDYHHTQDDVFEAVNKRELELGAAAISSFLYLLDKYGFNLK